MQPDFTFRSIVDQDGELIYFPLYRFSPGRWIQPMAVDGGLISCSSAYEAEACAARYLVAALTKRL